MIYNTKSKYKNGNLDFKEAVDDGKHFNKAYVVFVSASYKSEFHSDITQVFFITHNSNPSKKTSRQNNTTTTKNQENHIYINYCVAV